MKERYNVKKLVMLLALLLTSLVLTACGGDSDTAGSEESATESSFNEADVAFAQGMIPHHEQAIDMAQMAADRASSAEVKDLAAQIEAAQAPEIEQLSTWLEEWGEEAPSEGSDDGGMSGMDHDSGDMGGTEADMGGMMSEEDMTMLEGSSGADFDRMFLEMMIEHHNGAIEMAQTEVDEGEHQGAISMAEGIISTQQTEIQEMQQLLKQS